ncbi:hypothetical protein QNA08_11870 [Chelatococcus sp. SYSU_G07232]|uniref:DUF2946 domain-containing protein n=1 Tax=Chelatococcus albus TaxID=3047466 RepID=A0ABT7AHU4_9HYPH|nr:hypothetical protein [Chelatococcus sp. SYSU_G07232]MDJ1158933.1 hypothetical protein [Chelatococcus sp. SYSU_G07232]
MQESIRLMRSFRRWNSLVALFLAYVIAAQAILAGPASAGHVALASEAFAILCASSAGGDDAPQAPGETRHDPCCLAACNAAPAGMPAGEGSVLVVPVSRIDARPLPNPLILRAVPPLLPLGARAPPSLA